MADKQHEHEEQPGHGGGHGSHGPPHGGGAHEEHEGAPEWLISFADNVTLMMGFFVILLAMNLKPASGGAAGGAQQGGATGGPSPEMLDLAVAVRSAFNNPVDPASTDPQDIALIQHLLRRRGEGSALEAGMKGLDRDVETIRPGQYYSAGGRIEFADGEAGMPESSRQSLRDLAKRIRGTRYIVEVRGHVSAAEAAHHADRGLGFSYQRAHQVAEELVADGLGWGQIRIIACADNDRLAESEFDEAANRSNRRVEVMVRGDLVPEDMNVTGPGPE